MRKTEAFPGGRVERVPVERVFTTKTGKECRMVRKRIELTEEQREWLKRWYPKTENRVCAEAMGVSTDTVWYLARNMGLTKSVQGMKAIRRRAVAKTKETCEANGYYDSLRGKEASAALQQYRDKLRRGEIEPPITVMKRTRPKVYRAMNRRRSETMTETLRKERLRQFYGMERKTKWHLPTNRYTDSQISHRHNALRRGYFVMMDVSDAGGERYNIYYDKDTVRSEKFEQNCIKDGFTIKEAT